MKVKPGKIISVNGFSQSGKTAYVKHLVESKDRVLVWDVEGQYFIDDDDNPTHGAIITRTIDELLDVIDEIGGEPGRIVYQGAPVSDFEKVAAIAFAWARCGEQLGNESWFVAEETSDFTSPGKAPNAWGQLLRKGKKRGLTIVAVCQRLQESDKTAIGNADIVHVTQLVFPADHDYMAGIMSCSVEEIALLRADQDKGEFDYMQRNLLKQERITGKLTFPRGKAKFSKLL